MGIDIYARWEDQRDDALLAQVEAWTSATDGHIGYLREAYHGEPYATHYLVPEAFDTSDGVTIPARTLRERLPETLRLAERRQRKLYGATTKKEIEPVLRSFTAFVELCERMERATGKPVTIIASW